MMSLECDTIQAPTQQSGSSLTMLVSMRDTCGNKGLSKGALAGIVVGAAAFVIIVIILVGVLALKKGYCRRVFRFNEKDINLVM